MATFNQEYYLNIFDKVIEGIKTQVNNAERCWFHESVNKPLVPLTRFSRMTDEEKQDFVVELFFVYGMIHTTKLAGIPYKKQGGRFQMYFDLDLPFSSDEEREDMIAFRHHIVGTKVTADMLDQALL